MSYPKAIKKSEHREVINLYSVKLWSAKKIAEHFGIGLQTVYRFLRDKKIPRRGPREASEASFRHKPESFKIKHRLNKKEEELKIAGIMLYWAEGSKGYSVVDFVNSDPFMCLIFMRFLREVCGIDEGKLRGYIYCHPGQDLKKITNFWSDCLKIPVRRFSKPYIRTPVKSKTNKRPPRMRYGVVHIRYGDKKLLNQILTWIQEYLKYFVGR
ncbi:helix-turn-helix domain-containing protein [Candidatus Uhrbacteria bacterium]|nr:helix-turn-helix domain-containing protein [Candidatus Uhrbacteria bacterium]